MRESNKMQEKQVMQYTIAHHLMMVHCRLMHSLFLRSN